MPECHLSPYDTGAVLEPRPWHVQPLNLPSPEETERYGRVDFDDDEGQTIFTVRAVRVSNGYSLEITSLDPDTNLIPRIIEQALKGQ